MQTFNVNTFAYGTQEQALISFLHKGTSGKFYIKGLDINPNSPMQPGGAIDVKRYFRRISAVSGGFDLPYRKANLGNADLPSQIELVRRPDAITFVAGSPYRSMLMFPISLQGLSLRSGGGAFGKGSRMGTGDLWTTSRDTRIQGIILREGEGFAFGTSNSALPVFPFSFWMTITLRNTANNQTYILFTQIAPEEMKDSSLVIFNGSGSGITLEIVDIELADLGSPLNSLPFEASYLRLIRTYGHDGGLAVTPTPNNLADSVPSDLDVRRNFMGDDLYSFYAGKKDGINLQEDLGYPQLNTAIVRKSGTFGCRRAYQGAVAGVGVNSFGSAVMPGKMVASGMSCKKENAIVLRPNEGFAIVQSNNTGYSEFYIEATIIYEPDAVVTSGPTSWAY